MLIALLSLLVAQSPVPSAEGPIFSSPSTSGTGAFFEFAPASGRGLPSITPLCTQLAAGEKVGSWWCMDGSGAMASGSTRTLSAVSGATSAVSPRVCPNGPDCAAVTGSLYDATDTMGDSAGFSYTAPAGFTVCIHTVPSKLTAAGNRTLVSLSNGVTAANSVFNLYFTPVPQVAFTVSNAAGAATSLSFVAAGVDGAPGLYCGVYDGSNVTAYNNGTAAGSTAIVGALSAASQRFGVGGAWHGAAWNLQYDGIIFGSFYVETALSPARLAEIARAVLADTPIGAKGEAVNFTRSGNRFCPSTDNTGSMVPSNRPCVSRGGVRTDGVSDDLLLRRRDLANAAWTDVGTPGVAVASGLAPDGTLTAWTFTDDNAGAFEGRSQVYATGALNRYLGSLCLRAGTASSARLRLIGTGNAAGDVTATFTGLTSSWRCGWDLASPIKAVSPAAYGVGLTAVTYEITVGDTTAVTGTIDVAFPQMEVAQGTALAAPTLFCDGAAASIATCGNDNLDRTGIPAPVGSACTAMTVQGQGDAWQSGGGILAPILTDGAAGAALNGALYWWPFSNSNGGSLSADSVGAVSAGLASFNPVFGVVGSGTHRFLQAHTGSAWRVCQNGTCSTSGASTLGTPAFTRLKMDRPGVSAGNHPAQWVSQVQYDSTNYLRCTP